MPSFEFSLYTVVQLTALTIIEPPQRRTPVVWPNGFGYFAFIWPCSNREWEFDQLPNIILLQILQRLPFKERVRIACVNRRFEDVSDMAISRTRTLCMTAPIFRRANEESMTRLFQLCAPNLKELICELPPYSQVRIQRVNLLSKIPHPRLEMLKLDTERDLSGLKPDVQAIQDLFAGLPNLRRLEWSFPEAKFLKTVCANVRYLKVTRCYFDVLPHLAQYFPNLDHCSVTPFTSKGARTEEELDKALAKWTALQTLELKPMSFKVGKVLIKLEKVVNLWSLGSLRVLILRYRSNVTDGLLQKISSALTQLERLEVEVNSSLTSRGVAALKNLKHLRHLKIDWFVCSYTITDECAKELINFDSLEIIDIYLGTAVNPATIVAFAHRCPKLRTLRIRSIDGIRDIRQAESFVRSLAGFVQETLIIDHALPCLGMWQSAEIRSVLHDIIRRVEAVVSRFSRSTGSSQTLRPLAIMNGTKIPAMDTTKYDWHQVGFGGG